MFKYTDMIIEFIKKNCKNTAAIYLNTKVLFNDHKKNCMIPCGGKTRGLGLLAYKGRGGY